MKNYFILILCLSLLGCKKTPQDCVEKEYSQPNPSENNSIVEKERLIGTTSEQLTIFDILASEDGGLYFNGFYDASGTQYYDVVVGQGGNVASTTKASTAKYQFGKMTADGDRIWVKERDSTIRCITPIKKQGVADDFLLVTTSEYPNARVSLYNSSGQSLLDFLIEDKQYNRLWINQFKIISYSNNIVTLVGVGGVEKAGMDSPFLTKISINLTTNTVAKLVSNVFAFNNRWFMNVVLDINQPNVYYATANGEGVLNLLAIKITNDSQTDWTQEIKIDNNLNSYQHRHSNNLFYLNQRIYIIGDTEDNKDPKPSGGGFWDSGLVACLNTSGQKIWINKISVSNKQDQFSSGQILDNSLYVCGGYSGVLYISGCDETKKSIFENGVISKINISDGSLIRNYKIGNNHYNGLNSVALIGNHLIFAGYSSNTNGYATYQGWFLKVNKNNL